MTQILDNLDGDAADATPAKVPSDAPSLAEQRAKQKELSAWLTAKGRSVTGRLWLTALLGTGVALLAIPQAFLIAHLIAHAVTGTAALGAASLAVVALIAVVLFRAVLTFLREQTGFAASSRIRSDLRRRLVKIISTRSPSEREGRHSGGIASALIEQVDALDGYYRHYRPQRMIAAAVPMVMLVVVFPINWVVGLILIVTGPLVPVFMALVGIGAAAKSTEQFRTLTRMSGYFLDRLQGLATLKLFGQDKAELDRIEDISTEFRQGTMSVLRIAFLTSTVLEFFSALSIALVAVYVGLSLLNLISFGPHDSLNLERGLFLLLLAPDFFNPLRQLGAYYHDRASALGAADALNGFEAWDNPGPGLRNADPALLRVVPEIVAEDLSVIYPSNKGPRVALAGLSFKAEPGTITALSGPSGSGKSTFLHALLGFVSLSTGRFLVNGQPYEPSLAQSAGGHIAWVGQQAHLFHGTIGENIRMGNRQAGDEDVRAAAARAQVLDFIEGLDDGFETQVGERGVGLSGGQAQRIALARAFLSGARLLLLDEPTAHLDAENEALIVEAIRTCKGHQTVLIATHSPAVLGLADQIVPLARDRGEPS